MRLILMVFLFSVVSCAQRGQYQCTGREYFPVVFVTDRTDSTSLSYPTGGYWVITLVDTSGRVINYSPPAGEERKYRVGKYYDGDFTDQKPPKVNRFD